MEMEQPHFRRPSSTIRSFNGCWTCRLRRKKCDEKHPVCDACTALRITCYHDKDKPEWMDGGVKQREMTARLKREVKENANRHNGEHAGGVFNDASSNELHQILPGGPVDPTYDLVIQTPSQNDDILEPHPEASNIRPQRGADCSLPSSEVRGSISFGRSDTVLLTFYLEHLFPFQFPFYRPSILQGGRAWILEMMISSPVVRQATLCQSSYCFSLAQGIANQDVAWETVLAQTKDAFGVLEQSLRFMNGLGITEHLHGAVRVMTSIMQLQRFEIAVLSFANCQAHLNAAIALFRQLLDSPGAVELVGASSCYNAVKTRLGPCIWPTQHHQVPSAEQAAFCFSSNLLILDDIIASTVLQQRPRLYDYHHSLLGSCNGTNAPINLEDTLGCQNWALLQISEITVLDTWKQQCKRAGDLDVIELVQRATVIKNMLTAHLTRLESDPASSRRESSNLLDVLSADHYQQPKSPSSQSFLVTRVWAHAALLYLFVVVSGWQSASTDVRYHVGQIIELLTHQIQPPELMRTMVWPFCVAGCLAEPSQEAHLRRMVEALQPPSVFSTVHKALEIMENVWRNRDAKDAADRDLATCFKSQSDLILLV